MKTLMIAIAAAVSAAMFAAEPVIDYVDGENSAALITPEAEAALGALVGPQNARSLAHAMRLNMALYDSDMRLQSGRRHWHGKLIGEIVDTNNLYKIEVYSNTVNGAVWRFRTPFKPVAAKSANARVPKLSKAGMPARLAAARAQRDAERQQMATNTVDKVANPIPGK